MITSQQSLGSTPMKGFPGEHKKGASQESNTQHSCGNITGLTGSEFLSLPVGGARIAVKLEGVDVMERIEGFLQLQKL